MNSFTYQHDDGRKISSEQLERIERLKIPPAWEDVWICDDELGHLQATGRDAKGRKQYRYHDQWRTVRDENKYGRLVDFGGALPRIRRQVDMDLRRPVMDRPRALALAVSLLDQTLIRVGSRKYSRTSESFGLTTLREEHVEVSSTFRTPVRRIAELSSAVRGYDCGMDLTYLASVPEPVLDMGRRLNAHGRDAVLVGGAVRDVLLGAATGDWDLVTDASTHEIREALSHSEYVRSIYDVGERFGTVGVALRIGRCSEVSRYRSHALDAGTPGERFAIDAQHRDLTVNAIGIDLASGALLDPLDGQSDLGLRLLKAPGNPLKRLTEDPARVIRVARFVAELGFDVEEALTDALPSAAHLLEHIAPERIREELTKLLVAPYAPKGVEVLKDSRALAVVLPEVAMLDGLTQPSFHDLDVLAHTIQAVGLAPPTPVMRWATFLHDIGKGVTRTVEWNGRIRFFGHAKAGAEMAREITARLRFSTSDAKSIVHLVASHMHLGDVNLRNPKSVDRAVRKLDLRVEDSSPHMLVSAEDLVELTLADFGATSHRHEAPRLREQLESAIAASRERGTQRAVVSPVSGVEIMHTFDLAEGPEVGIAKNAIEAAIKEGDLAPDDVDGALAIAGAALGREDYIRSTS